jgi:hypothetical protein
MSGRTQDVMENLRGVPSDLRVDLFYALVMPNRAVRSRRFIQAKSAFSPRTDFGHGTKWII